MYIQDEYLYDNEESQLEISKDGYVTVYHSVPSINDIIINYDGRMEDTVLLGSESSESSGDSSSSDYPPSVYSVKLTVTGIYGEHISGATVRNMRNYSVIGVSDSSGDVYITQQYLDLMNATPIVISKEGYTDLESSLPSVTQVTMQGGRVFIIVEMEEEN